MAKQKTKSLNKPTKALPNSTVKNLDAVASKLEVARAQTDVKSKQPRFSLNPNEVLDFINSIYQLAKEAIYNEPAYGVGDSSRRDAWLAKVVKRESYLNSILQSVVSIDKNRGFTLTGGKIQVKKFVNILHNFQVAPDLSGWRPAISVVAQNYYQADLGAPVEIGRTIPNGPLAALFTVDPTKCVLTGKTETPLRYKNGPRDKQYWEPTDYFRVVSFPSTLENLNGLGYCAVSRCIELAKLMVSVFEHDRQKLGSKAPKGIMTINGVSLEQWLTSLEEMDDELKALHGEYYNGIQVLANDGKDIKVELTSFSNLPENFNQETFVDMIIYGYALAFGYDPREFWPVSSGSIGTGNEAQNQHRKASTKGGLDFALDMQEKMQEELPESIGFEFEQRDVVGDIAEAEFSRAQLDLIDQMYQSENSTGKSLISFDEARQLMVKAKLIPDEWTETDEEVQVTDTEDMAALDKERTRTAMERFPKEDIVVYNSRTNKFRTILSVADRPLLFNGVSLKKKKRAILTTYEAIRARYYDAVYTTVSDYLESNDRSTSYKSAFGRSMLESFTDAAERGYFDGGGGEFPVGEDVNDWLAAAQDVEMGNIANLFINLKTIRDSGEFNADAEATARAEGYTHTLDGIYNTAVTYGLGNQMLTFDGEDGAESCDTCMELKGQRHRASWWISHDYIPPTGAGLDCAAGGHCKHHLVNDDGEIVTLQ